MKYKLLYLNFKKLFPYNTEDFTKLETANNVDQSEGQHILFGLVVAPFIQNLAEQGNFEKLELAFTYFEAMAKSNDILVNEVLEFSVLENLLSHNVNYINIYKKLIGPETNKYLF